MMVAPKFTPFQTPLSVPLALSSRKNWIGWRLVHNPDDQDNPKKMPVVLVPGVSVNDYLKPHAHVGYEEALAQVGPLRLAGVGFVMTLDCGMIGGDMDKCRDPATGVIEPWAQAIIDRRETYFEISPSGRGVRFFSLTDMPLRDTIQFKPAGVELYSKLRYLTFTGDRIIGTPLEVQRAPYAVETLMRRVADFKAAAPPSKAAASQPAVAPAGSFEEIAARKAYRDSPMGQINEAAMKDFDAWVPELLPSAEKTADGGYRVKSASPDLNRPLQEDLSIHPTGIKDWGVHDQGDPREGGRTPIDVVMEHSDPPLDNVGAAEWLGARVGVPFDGPNTGSSGGSPADVPPLTPVSPTGFKGRTPPPREWIVQDWVPVGVVTGLYGDGGTGKSLLAQQLQTSTALGQAWIGQTVQQCISLGLYCEDDENELWRRQEAINAAHFCDHGALGGMHLLARPVEDNALMTFARNGIGELTKLHKRLVEAALDVKARLVVVDTAADTFMGSENDRGQVRQYVQRALGAIAVQIGGAVVCCAHPSLSGLISGSGTAGSTGWNNAFRSRHYLELPKDEPEDTPLRTFTRKKANYAARGTVLGLRWASGVLVPDTSLGSASVAGRRPCVDVFRDLLREFIRQGRLVSSSRTARNGPGALFGSLPKADREGYEGRDFMAAMETLLREGKIISVSYKNKGYESFKLEFPIGIL